MGQEVDNGLKRALPWLAIFLALAAILLSASFQFTGDHRWYWRAATAVSIIVVLAAASGGLLLGRSLAPVQGRRLWLLIAGGIVLVAWAASAAMAVSFASLGMNYFHGSDIPINWDSYQGDYMAGWFNIRFLQVATLLGLPGGFLFGSGLSKAEKK
jgi:hypothetical protein